jgi:hypothetical protein
MSTYVYETRRNLCVQPSFEAGTSPWGVVQNTLERSSEQALFGDYSLKATATGVGSRPALTNTAAIPATVGTTYTASFYGRVANTGRSGGVILRFFNLAGTILASNIGTISAYTANEWKRFESSGVAPATTAYVGMVCYLDQTNIGTAGDVAYVDGVLIEAASSAGVYFDGDSIGGLWTGTADASASTLGGLTDDPPVVPGFISDENGNIAVTTDTRGASYEVVPGFLADEFGRLVVTTTTTDAEWDGGFLRLDGALVVEEAAGTYGTVPGFTTTASGALAVVNEGTVDWVSGFLRDANDSLGVTGL